MPTPVRPSPTPTPHRPIPSRKCRSIDGRSRLHGHKLTAEYSGTSGPRCERWQAAVEVTCEPDAAHAMMASPAWLTLAARLRSSTPTSSTAPPCWPRPPPARISTTPTCSTDGCEARGRSPPRRRRHLRRAPPTGTGGDIGDIETAIAQVAAALNAYALASRWPAWGRQRLQLSRPPCGPHPRLGGQHRDGNQSARAGSGGPRRGV
jgi:hypothetical protein